MLAQPELGGKILELRKSKGLTQEELVKECNISVRTLQRIESGSVTPRPFTIRTIFEVLGYTYHFGLENEVKNDLSQSSKSPKSIIKAVAFKNRKVSKALFLVPLILIFIVSIIFFKLLGFSKSEKLEGNWKLVGTFHNNIFYEVNDLRTMDFGANNDFISYTKNGLIYNSGKYYANNDSTFITRHYVLGGSLSKTLNQYKYSISNDTLRFEGYFNQVVSHSYKPILIDEVWVRNRDGAGRIKNDVKKYGITQN